jgi:hypothetical protein
MIKVCQCPPSLEKWEELVVGSVQAVLGLTVNTNKLTVGITSEYRKQVRDILTSAKWTETQQPIINGREAKTSSGWR